MPNVLVSTSPTYTPGAGSVGATIYCRVRGTNSVGFSIAQSLTTAPVVGAGGALPPSLLSAPAIADLTPSVGEILHTTDGTWAGVPTPTFSYQWHRVITGAPEAPASLTAPAIADLTPQVGEVLHTTDGTWSGEPTPTLSYQWHRVTVDVGTPPSITTPPAIADVTPEVGETLHTTDGVWAGDPTITYGYQWHRVTADPVAPSGGTPSIADTTPVEGETLHVDHGTWAGTAPIAYSYQWKRGATNVGTDSADYLLVAGDVTFNMSCVVTATNAVGSSSPATSNVVGPVASGATLPANTVAPVLTGSAVEGSLLTVTDGTWTGTPTPTFTRQWKRNGTNIGTGATTYTTVAGDVGFNITCVVTGSNTAGAVPATSNAIGPITAGGVAPDNTVAPAIADITPVEGETLHTTDGTWSGTPAPTFGYQWFQVGTTPVITSSATATNVENTVLAHALTADQSVTWAIYAGVDNARFEISGSTLRWLANGTKNFEAPNDADVDNAYVVVVRATATTGQTATQTITVTVTNVVIEATLTFDFQANTSTIAGTAATAVVPLTVTRAGTAFYAERLDGVWTSFGANTARRTDRGLLIEEARTNVCLQSRTQTNASWVKTNVTATKNQVGIDGVANSACSLTATAVNGTCLVTCTIASSARWQTAFIKRLVGTGFVQMTMDNGTTWTTVTITSSWARYSIPTQTLANPVVGFRIATSGDSIAVDFVQNENSGTFATSPIPTTTATVTRAADVIVVNTTVAPIASWFTETAGTLFAEGEPYGATLATSTVFQIDSGAATNLHYVGLPGGTAAAGGTTTASTVVGTFTATRASGVNKSAWAYALNDMAGSHNGGAVVTDATGAMPTGLTTTRLGKLVAATMWSGYLRKITFYNGRMANADLVTLTTL